MLLIVTYFHTNCITRQHSGVDRWVREGVKKITQSLLHRRERSCNINNIKTVLVSREHNATI